MRKENVFNTVYKTPSTSKAITPILTLQFALFLPKVKPLFNSQKALLSKVKTLSLWTQCTAIVLLMK